MAGGIEVALKPHKRNQDRAPIIGERIKARFEIRLADLMIFFNANDDHTRVSLPSQVHNKHDSFNYFSSDAQVTTAELKSCSDS